MNEVAGGRLYSVQVKIAVALIYASAALPFHIAYGTLTSALIASTIALAAAGLLVYLMPAARLWQYGMSLALVGLPLAYVTGTPPIAVGLLVALLSAAVQRAR